MPRERQLGLWANQPRLRARKRIDEHQYDELDYQGVYDLFLQAFGDEKVARDARLESMKLVVRQETEAARIARGVGNG